MDSPNCDANTSNILSKKATMNRFWDFGSIFKPIENWNEHSAVGIPYGQHNIHTYRDRCCSSCPLKQVCDAKVFNFILSLTAWSHFIYCTKEKIIQLNNLFEAIKGIWWRKDSKKDDQLCTCPAGCNWLIYWFFFSATTNRNQISSSGDIFETWL